MSISARARTLSTEELLRLYEASPPEDQRELSEALFKRLSFMASRPHSNFIPKLHN